VLPGRSTYDDESRLTSVVSPTGREDIGEIERIMVGFVTQLQLTLEVR
jgi:hypothetical protein